MIKPSRNRTDVTDSLSGEYGNSGRLRRVFGQEGVATHLYTEKGVKGAVLWGLREGVWNIESRTIWKS